MAEGDEEIEEYLRHNPHLAAAKKYKKKKKGGASKHHKEFRVDE